uniref:Uncharacterized protein n=1 Tax=Spironucleus salmonicida TaxID=348837 RepID=V6LF30_9EUKA|eukprot:EST42286.1 Hypothetical protein SS50377_18154 [Spironucleus salmonicida]
MKSSAPLSLYTRTVTETRRVSSFPRKDSNSMQVGSSTYLHSTDNVVVSQRNSDWLFQYVHVTPSPAISEFVIPTITSVKFDENTHLLVGVKYRIISSPLIWQEESEQQLTRLVSKMLSIEVVNVRQSVSGLFSQKQRLN